MKVPDGISVPNLNANRNMYCVLLDFYPFALAWIHCNRNTIDAISSYCNYMRLVARRSKLSSSNRGSQHFFGVIVNVWLLQRRKSLQNIGFATTSIMTIDGFYHA
jgi:hypothetical protein